MKLFFTFFVLFFSANLMASEFFHPSKFTGSEADKNKVTEFIKANVEKTYSEIGMGDPLTLRTMEKEELDCFKQLTKVSDKKLLDSVITQYCSIGMCNYNTILMMYNEQEKATNEQLEW